MTQSNDWVNENTMIPDLLLAAPYVRPVLDQYGLRGCGGKLGPMESLRFFAQAHDVPLDQLLTEIKARIAQVKSAGTANRVTIDDEPPARLEDSIYKPFFMAGIVTILTAGAVWGAYLLLRIAFWQNFTAVGIHEVNAHGHAQIFGWVGLFVMGFAYQAFPRFKHTSLAHPRLAFATLWLMLAGILIRVVGEPAGTLNPLFWDIVVVSSVLQISAISLFVFIVIKTLFQSDKPLAFYDSYILCALFWFWVQGIYSAALFSAMVYAPDQETLLYLISTWQAPLREIQIHGFAMLMILGVSQRLFHHFYGLPKPDPNFSLRMLFLINAALVGVITGFVLMRTGSHAWAALWYGSVLLLVASTVSLVLSWKIFSKPQESDRTLKFMRASYIWLFISLGMLVALPFYQSVVLPFFASESGAAQMGFSHAYYGAVRHAITVGFISLMIVGVASKVVPTLNGVDIKALSPLWLPFWLINAGCALRLIGQTLTDFSSSMFPVTGASGLLEVTGLLIWGLHMADIMTGQLQSKLAKEIPLQPNEQISGNHKVGDVLALYPHLLDEFIVSGFTPLSNPVLRRTVAKSITIAGACRRVDINPNDFVQQLNQKKNRVQEYNTDQPLYQISNN